MEHPLATIVLAAIAGWTAIQLLHHSAGSAVRQVAAAIVIGGAFVVGLLMQQTDLVEDAIEGPTAIGAVILIAALGLLIPLATRRRRPG